MNFFKLFFRYKKKEVFLIGMSLLFLLLPMMAQSQDLTAKKIKLNISKVTLKTALSEIQKQSGILLAYGEDLNKYASIRVTIVEDNISIKEAISQVLSGTNLRYAQEDGHVIIEEKAPLVPQQRTTGRGSLSGTVLDEQGTPVTGAIVSVPGTSIGTATDGDGRYTLPNIPSGTTNVQFSFLGYEDQLVSDVKIITNRSTPLDIVMKEAANELGEVVVTAKSYTTANEAGVMKIQQNAPQVSSVMSAQQIGKTSDKNLGEALKRVTGISTSESKYVVVRGLGERWNEAALDGVTLPSTEPSNKAFSFDLIPTNIIDNVVVVKLPTPDMSANFAGGFVQINTKAIPDENFMTVSAGGTWNSVSTGKEQLHRERRSLDWLGFDDGGRKWPVGLTPNFWGNHGREGFLNTTQALRFAGMGDNFSIHSSKTPPSGNIQLTLGRAWTPESRTQDRWGFISSLSYRNTQQQTMVEHNGHGSWSRYRPWRVVDDEDTGIREIIENKDAFKNPASVYKYGTVLSGLFNLGYKSGPTAVNFRNTYTRKYDNDLSITTGWSESEPYPDIQPPHQTHFNAPTFQDLLQNKLDGEAKAGAVKFNWLLAHTYIRRNQMDVVESDAYSTRIDGENFFRFEFGSSTESDLTRSHYDSRERDFNWGVSAEIPFLTGAVSHTAKVGYDGFSKANNFLFEDAYFMHTVSDYDPDVLWNDPIPLADKLDPYIMADAGYFWGLPTYSGTGGGDSFVASSQQHDPYFMFDHRWGSLLRLVWGMRAEYYNYAELSNPYYNRENPTDTEVDRVELVGNSAGDKKWEILPSANLTVTPVKDFNIRLGYARSMVRPGFSERAAFEMWDPWLDAYVSSDGVNSSYINAADFKLEWFPGAGEIISAGAFYRYIDQPIERVMNDVVQLTNPRAYFTNQEDAVSWGFEFELRKNFAFIYNHPILRNLYAYGNATIINSEIQQIRTFTHPKTGEEIIQTVGEPRPLYGQTPLLYNLGLTYEGEQLGLNLAFNHTARRMNIVSTKPDQHEYEAAGNQLDAQISWTFPKQGITLKLSGSNLLDHRSIFYWNNSADYAFEEAYTQGGIRQGGWYYLKPGKSDEYDKYDVVRYISRTGRSFSFSASWTF